MPIRWPTKSRTESGAALGRIPANWNWLRSSHNSSKWKWCLSERDVLRDFLKGSTIALVTSDAWPKTQLCIVADYVQTHGELSLIQKLWPRKQLSTNSTRELLKIGIIYTLRLQLSKLHIKTSVFPGNVPALFHLYHGKQNQSSDLRTVFLYLCGVWEGQGVYMFMFLHFWKENRLCRVFLCRSRLPTTGLNGELGSLSRLPPAISTKAHIVASSRCSGDLVRTIGQSDYFCRGVQSCYRFSRFSLPNWCASQVSVSADRLIFLQSTGPDGVAGKLPQRGLGATVTWAHMC